MTNFSQYMLAVAAGALLGGFFFGGLWFTIRKATTAKVPGLWFAASLLLRMAVTLAGFYFIARGSWQRLLVALAGFLVARFVVTRFIKTKATAGLQKGGTV